MISVILKLVNKVLSSLVNSVYPVDFQLVCEYFWGYHVKTGYRFNTNTKDMPDKNLFNTSDLIKKVAKKSATVKTIEVLNNATFSTIYLNKPKKKRPTHSSGSILSWDGNKREVLRFENEHALLLVGTKGNEGDIVVKNSFGNYSIHLNGNEGQCLIYDSKKRKVFNIDGENANMHVGAKGKQGDIYLYNNKGLNTVHLSGQAGDIVLKNGDAAEHFDVAENVLANPGTIMVLNSDGKLIPSDEAYNTKVVGVVAGAGDYKPAILLDADENSTNRVPISILGKVTCKADATNEPIQVGDMLTTSILPGHAMKATDFKKSFGAIVGKALTSLTKGTGYVNMLVSLQ
ncbi:hypothetical protein POV27_02640 [Aureisphaera galaxeae]|uniref:hypothetical protein n=1 Tax=Aureisphaera galaxeae TaxID=1538023 RepID=UPI00234FC526|nr:hypothetical protein [Aureisphaera galaxeae]MDC8002929.1 hypothetical protein [Aureisphaera galaxeae]